MKNQKIENLRAVAILMVVFGHSIIIYSSSWNLYSTTCNVPLLDWIKNIINLIQMPVFIAISGYLYWMKFDSATITKTFFTDKCKRLLIPWLTFGLFWMIPIRILIGYKPYSNLSVRAIIFNFLTGKDCGHLWYLPTLFLIFFFFTLIHKIFKLRFECKTSIFYIIILSLLNVVSLKLSLSPYISFLAQYSVYFGLGILLKQYETRYLGIFKLKIGLYAIVIGTIMMTTVALFIKTASVFASIMWVLLLYGVIPNCKVKFLHLISKNSFGIYLFHSPLVYISYAYWPNIHPWLMIGVNFFLFGFISYLLVDVFRIIKIKWALGE